MIDLECLRLEANYISSIIDSSLGEKAKLDFQECFQIVILFYFQPSNANDSCICYIESLENYISIIKNLDTFYSTPSTFQSSIKEFLKFLYLLKQEVGVCSR